MVIAFVLISVERLIAKQSCKSEKFESFALDKVSALVNDGVMDMKELKRAGLSHERVFAQLRSQGILQLGSVSRFYMEAGGSFTLVRNPVPAPGLSVLPPWDDSLRDCFHEYPEKKICIQCGLSQDSCDDVHSNCSNCSQNKWVTAVTEI